MPIASLQDIVDDETTPRTASLDDIVEVAPAPKPTIESILGPMKPAAAHAVTLPPENAPAVSKPGEIERQMAWSLSPARDAAAARRHQPPANVPVVDPITPLDPATAAWKAITAGSGAPLPPMEDLAKVPVLGDVATGAVQAGKALPVLARAAGRTLTSALPPAKPGLVASRASMLTGQLPSAPAPLAQPETLAAGADVLEGGFKMLEPLLIAGGIEAPLQTIAALVGSVGAAKATEKIAQLAQLTPEMTRLLSDVAGAIGVYGVPIVRQGVRAAGEWGRGRMDAAAGRSTIPPEPTDIVTTPVRESAGALPPGPQTAPITDIVDVLPPAEGAAADVTEKKAAVEDLLSQLNGGPSAEVPQAPAAPPVTTAGALPPTSAAVPAPPPPDVTAAQPAGDSGGTVAPAGTAHVSDIVAVAPVEEPPPTETIGPTLKDSGLRLNRVVDEGGTIQLGFHRVDTPEHAQHVVEQIKLMFPDNRVSVETIRRSPIFTDTNYFFKVSFWTPDGRLDYRASKAAREQLGGHLYEPPAPAPPVGDKALTAHVDDIAGPAPEERVPEKPVTIHTRRELGRMAAELEAMPFTKRGFVDAGPGQGGDLEVVPGAAGTPVYDDILQAAPGTSNYSRGNMAAAIRKYLKTGTLTNPVRGAIEVAHARATGQYVLGARTLSRPQLPPDAGNEPGQLYVSRKRQLSPELQAVRERAAAAVESEPAAVVDRYIREFGNVVGSDQAKELFPDYQANRTQHSSALHEPSQTIAQAVYDKLISEPVPAGKDPIVVFTAGGTGSGKTTGVDLVAPNAKHFAHVIYDSTLAEPALAFRNIDRALATGHDVAIVYTYRPLERAFEHGVLPRAMADGRTVRIDAHVRTHLRSLQTIQRIQERYATQLPNEPRVDVLVVDNSGERSEAKLSNIAALRDVRYTKADATAALTAILEREHEARRISPEVYAATQVPRPAEVQAPIRGGSEKPAGAPEGTVPEKVDTLDTGEQQPRLPDAGPVRDTEKKTPEFDAPFSLSGDAHDAGSVQEPLFRDRPKGKGGGGNAMRIDERPQTRAGGSTLQSAVVPGLKEFVEQDVVPGAKQAAADVVEAGSDIKTLFAPASASAAARDFSHVVRANLAARDQRLERARRRTKAIADQFDRRLRGAKTDTDKAAILLEFTDAVEAGESQDLPADLQPAAALFRELLNDRRTEIQKLGKLQTYIANYFPHEWTQPNQAVNALKRLFGKRPLQGPKAFLKKRSIPTTREGIKLGLVPVSYNPVELVLRKLTEMDKFIAATRILKDGQKQGLTKYVAIGDGPPDGWKKFDHSFAVVYGKPTVTIKEAYDKILMEKLEAFAESLGVTTARKQSLGGSVWGLAYGDKRIETRFAGPETVLEHEIGHILDERFGLRHGMVNKKLYRQELRDLADLRDEGTPAKDVPQSRHRYVRKGEEKIANLVHAFIYNPEKAKQVAPNSYWLLYNMAKSTPALKPLIDLQKARSLTLTAATTEKPIGGALIKGYYYGPPEVVRLLDNHLSPGLRKSVAFNLYRRAGNFMNQVQLGLSAFHLTMTGMESVISKQSLAFEQLARGQVGQALRTQLEVPVAPLVDLRRGHQLLKQFYVEDANAQTFDGLIESVVQGGGGFGWSLFEHEGAPAKFMQALRQGNYPGAALRAIPALVELQAKPIMEGWVPRLKMAAFIDIMRMELPTLGPEPNLAELRRVAGDAWDSIDNRFGQLRYDNLFWHTALKDLGMASVRALGWNIGSLREAGGVPGAQLRALGLLPGGGFGGKGGGGKRPTRLVDVGVGPDGEPQFAEDKEPWLHRKAAWLMATVFIYGLAGAIYQYLHTGKGPTELKDYYFPHNGDGETRVSIPGYPKDWYSFGHRLPGSAIDTAKHKLNPLLGLLADVLTNQDYFGTAVRNPDDPFLEQLKDLTSYIGDQFQPMSVKNFRARRDDEQLSGKSTGVNAGESFFGVNRAPASVSRSEAEELVREYNPPSGRTKEQAAQAQLRREIRQGLQARTPAGRAQAVAAAKSGELTDRQIQAAMRSSRLTYLQGSVKALSIERALHVYEVATPDERRLLRSILQAKSLTADVPATQRAALTKRYRAAMALPVAKPTPESAFR